MQGPSWLAVLLAVIMIATAAYCASRLVVARARRRPDERDVDLVRTVMGVAMAGMLVSWLNPLPDRVWAVMFGAATSWFSWQAWRGRRAGRAPAAAPGDGWPPHPHHMPHLVMCGAMVYMLLAAHAVNAGPGPRVAMGGPAAAGRFPVLALILAVFMVGYVMWQADRLPSLAWAGAARAGAARAGASAAAAILATGSGTAPTAAPRTATGDAPAAQATGTAQATGAAPGLAVTADLAAAPGPRALSPRLTACCQIAMGVTMGYMLVLML